MKKPYQHEWAECTNAYMLCDFLISDTNGTDLLYEYLRKYGNDVAQFIYETDDAVPQGCMVYYERHRGNETYRGIVTDKSPIRIG